MLASSPSLTVTKLKKKQQSKTASSSPALSLRSNSPSKGISRSMIRNAANLPNAPPPPAPPPSGKSTYQPKLANTLTFNPLQTHRPIPPATEGNTKKYMDKELNKMCFKIRGTVSSANYVTNSAKVKDLLLRGKYIYSIFRRVPDQALTMHLDFVTSKALSFRITISTFFSEPKVAGNTLRLPLSHWFSDKQLADDSWVILALDVPAVIKKFASGSFVNDSVGHLRSTTSCASMALFGIFVSDVVFSRETLCEEISISNIEKFKWCPKRPKAVLRDGSGTSSGGNVKTPERSASANFFGSKELLDENSSMLKVRRVNGKSNLTPRSQLTPERPTATPEPQVQQQQQQEQQQEHTQRQQQQEEPLLPLPFGKSPLRNTLFSPPIPPRPLKPTKLSRIIGCGGGSKSNNISWCDDDKRLCFNINNSIVSVDVKNEAQQFIHNLSPVSLTTVSQSSKLIGCASSTFLKIFNNGHHCVANISLHNSKSGELPPKPISIAFNVNESSFACVLLDSQRRTSIVIYDVSSLSSDKDVDVGGDPTSSAACVRSLPILGRQTSDFPITKMSFSPYENSRLVSCGSENVRFWRLKSDHLPACPAILNEFARGTAFTDVAFESSYGMLDDRDIQKIVFVSSDKGTILQISYTTRSVLCVLRLHTGPINTLCVNEGYAVTGGSDGYLRLWPLDFSDFLLEAKHEGGVEGVALSRDGLTIGVCCEGGTIGVLDVVTQSYETVMRSHTDTVLSIVPDPIISRANLATLSADRTIRIWCTNSGIQKFEFASPQDPPTCVAYHPTEQVIACGFASGFVRIFDVESTETIYELEQHTNVVLSIAYDCEGSMLYAAASDGHISVFDVKEQYTPVKTVACDVPEDNVVMCLSADGQYLCSTGPDKNSLCVYEARSLVVVKKINMGESFGEVKALYFADDSFGFDICAITSHKVHKISNCGAGSVGKCEVHVESIFSGVSGGAVSNGSVFACKRHAKTNLTAVSFRIPDDSKTKSKSAVYIYKNKREVARCVGCFGQIACLGWSAEGGKLFGSDEAGVIYSWDIDVDVVARDGDEAKEEGGEEVDLEGEGEVDRDSNGSLDARFILSELAKPKILSMKNVEQMLEDQVQNEESKKTETETDTAAPKTLSVEETINVVIDELYQREWIEWEIAKEMRNTELDEHAILVKAVMAFNEDLDFEKLLENVFTVSKFVRAKLHPDNVVMKESEREREWRNEPEGDGEYSSDEGFEEYESAPLEDFSDEEEDEHKVNSSLLSFYENGEIGAKENAGRAFPAKLTKIEGYAGSAAAKNSLVWDPNAGKLVYCVGNVLVSEDLELSSQNFSTHENHSSITSLAVSSSGDLIATGATASWGSLRVWELGKDGETTKLMTNSHHDIVGVVATAFVCDDSAIVSVGEYNSSIDSTSIVVWDINKKRLLTSTSVKGELIKTCCGLSWRNSSFAFATGGSDGAVLYSLDANKSLLSPTQCELDFFDGHAADEYISCVNSNDLSPNILFAGSNKGVVWMFDARQKKALKRWNAMNLTESIVCICSRSDKVIVSGDKETLGVWEIGNVSHPVWRTRISGGVKSMSFDREGVEGVVGCGDSIKYLKVGGGEVDLVAADAVMEGVSYSCDGRLVAKLCGGVCLVGAGDGGGESVAIRHGARAILVQFSNKFVDDGRSEIKLAVCFQDGAVKIFVVKVDCYGSWSLADGEKECCTFVPFESSMNTTTVKSCCFSEGSLVCATESGEIAIWDIESSAECEEVFRDRSTFGGNHNSSKILKVVSNPIIDSMWVVVGKSRGGKRNNFVSVWQENEQVDCWIPRGPSPIESIVDVAFSSKNPDLLVCLCDLGHRGGSCVTHYSCGKQAQPGYAINFGYDVAGMAASEEGFALVTRNGVVQYATEIMGNREKLIELDVKLDGEYKFSAVSKNGDKMVLGTDVASYHLSFA